MKPKKRAGPRCDLDDYKTFDSLYHHLVILGKSKKQLAEELGVSLPTINAWTKLYNWDINFHVRSNIGKRTIPLAKEARQRLSDTLKQQYKQGRKPANSKGREVRLCEICGSEFQVIKDSRNSKQQARTTCSRSCADKKHSLYLQSLPMKVEKVQIICVHCKALFEVYPSLGHLQFCSYECAQAHRKGKTYEELYGIEKAQKTKAKLAKFRATQSQNLITRPVAELVKVLTLQWGDPELEYQIAHYTVDICYPSLRLAIEVDGNYWHNYPVGLPRDVEKTNTLKGLGWKVLRYWESDILADSEAILRQIKEELDNDRTI